MCEAAAQPEGRCHSATVHAVTNASRTCLLDLSTLQWSKEVASEMGVPVDALPRVCSSSEHFGDVAAGPLQGVPICGCLGDQHAALLGTRHPPLTCS